MSIKQEFIKVIERFIIEINYNKGIRIDNLEKIRNVFINIDKMGFKFGGDAIDNTCSGRLKFYIDENGALTIYENDCNSIFKCKVAYIDIFINGNDDISDPEIFIYSAGIGDMKIIKGIKYAKNGVEEYDENKVREYLEQKYAYENGESDESPEKARIVTLCNEEALCYYINLKLLDIKTNIRRAMPNRLLFFTEREKYNNNLMR